MIQSYQEEYDAFAGLFDSGWRNPDNGEYYTDIAWSQIPYEPSRDENGDIVPFVSFSVRNSSVQQESIGSMGSNVMRHFGDIIVNIYVKPSQGEMYARELADIFCTIFRNNVTIEGVAFAPPFYEVVGSVADGMFMVMCSCPFRRDSYL